MNRTELIDKVAAGAGVERAQTEAVLTTLFATVVEAARAGDRVGWPGFGVFSVADRAARTGHHPRTGEAIEIPAGRALRFNQASGLRTALNP
ncbi:MAG: HU family DNA-binding protein [Acidimicrobiales bacterium]